MKEGLARILRHVMRSDDITEALYEMHYYQAIVEIFANTFGAKFLSIMKPSAQREVWVGFGQRMDPH
jgi:hypothetical protein